MMPLAAESLRNHALQIWRAGLDAVRSERLVHQWCRVEGNTLQIGGESFPLDSIRRIAVVGAGKAGAGMAEAVESALGPRIIEEKQLVGWVNVPGDCVRPLNRIHLHAARPAGVNEPRPEGAAGAAEILRIVESLGPDDLCLCLISGGGSALMPSPVEGISLADKLAVTRHLSAAGANIEQLNIVRKQLSRIKGGGLLRACRAGRLVSLIISDVLGDPLDVIASGPTVPDSSTPAAALAVLDQFSSREAGISPSVFDYLKKSADAMPPRATQIGIGEETIVVGQVANLPQSGQNHGRLATCPTQAPRVIDSPVLSGPKQVFNFVIGNNSTAVDAAAAEANRLGYEVVANSATRCEGLAEQIGEELTQTAIAMRAGSGPTCTISGGEPVVKLVDASQRGLGGRNQQLVLAALARLFDQDATGIALLSAGTDGEDGPTDAAGALCDAEVIATARRCGLDPTGYLARNDAYHFFQQLDALIHTGPTHTNVCDLRVAVVRRP